MYGITLESREHAIRGWNWGKADFGKAELSFDVQNRPAFEIPYTEISNTNLAGKNEVAVELFAPRNDKSLDGANGASGRKSKKLGGARDELVEMRFYIPGTTTTTTKAKKGDGDEDAEMADGENEEEEETVEEQNAANLFYDTLMDKADIGEVAGETYATFLDILHLTPRGRFDLDMYEKSFRMRGKTYDYKILYDSIKKFMILPKPDDLHSLIVIGLDPPLRQGQTRYPFLVMQFKRDEEIELELNMTEEVIKEKYPRLEPRYEAPQYSIIGQIFRGLAGKKVITPSQAFKSHHDQSGVKCSIKANEGHLFCLDKAFMFVPKPAQFIAFEFISEIVMSRVGGAISASRTFDITVRMKNGQSDTQFSNINREEQQPLENFFNAKGLNVKNEMLDDSSTLIAKALKEDVAMGDSDDEAVPRADRGSADEDSESPDEDFQADSDSDVAEEFDSDHESSGGSDDEAGAGSGGDSDPPEDEERPKKKSKVSK